MTNAAARCPVNLLCRIEAGLCDILGGDIGYMRRIMKKPTTPPNEQYFILGKGY
ncbi:hypothetical protein GSS88_09205 [Corynebacterium sp. 3HC-13]|nr:hypothetical protein [Corynebacterium poyangense]